MDQDLKARFDDHPYGALAAAVGVGYVLGGGVFTPLTGRIVKFALKVGLRAAVVPFVAARLTALLTPGPTLPGAAASPMERREPPHQEAA